MPDVELSKLHIGESFFCMIEWDVSELSLPKSALPSSRQHPFRASGYSCAASLANRSLTSESGRILPVPVILSGGVLVFRIEPRPYKTFEAFLEYSYKQGVVDHNVNAKELLRGVQVFRG
jgi:hypothetical protein